MYWISEKFETKANNETDRILCEELRSVGSGNFILRTRRITIISYPNNQEFHNNIIRCYSVAPDKRKKF